MNNNLVLVFNKFIAGIFNELIDQAKRRWRRGEKITRDDLVGWLENRVITWGKKYE